MRCAAAAADTTVMAGTNTQPDGGAARDAAASAAELPEAVAALIPSQRAASERADPAARTVTRRPLFHKSTLARGLVRVAQPRR